MAISLKGADELVHACDKAKVHLFVVKQNRLNAPVQMLKRAVDSGRFGRHRLAERFESTVTNWEGKRLALPLLSA